MVTFLLIIIIVSNHNYCTRKSFFCKTFFIKGKYFTHEDEGVIIYEVNGVTYTIQGAVSKQQLLKMMENREKVR